ncbi:hypothetical protein HBH64_157670 [Parastagonospora nodorum]|nr:hypothetical protein HBI01_020930 [Parastagonospora nodorum]KAH4316778.1 hypothetical protein HBI02_037270 [Parastagonospora nodorum]KAH4326748.1 hypothetical protein HBI00_141170 [Parastagonospora nodorum]KAH4388601.1 hypothetical protein HBH94_037130 [Parastagonospora nodorum]KAH4405854.1 hypothetical protein HBH92_171180 [Parastagonospora nodorum]
MALSKSRFCKRKHTSSQASDGEDTHPSSKRDAPPGEISPPDGIKSPAKSASELSPSQKGKQHRRLTVSQRIILWILVYIGKDFRISESGVNTETKKEYHITANVQKMVMSCAVRRMEKARRAGKTNYDLAETVSRALDRMKKLTHQHEYLDLKCSNGGPSDFRERLEWADFHVMLAEEQLENEAEMEPKKQKPQEQDKQRSRKHDVANKDQAEGEASQYPMQQSWQEATLPPGEKELPKQNVAEGPTESQSNPEQHALHTNEPASGQRLDATNISSAVARPMYVDNLRQLQPQSPMELGGFENREAAQAPSLPSALATSLPSYHELRACVDACRRSPRTTACEQLAYRGPLPSLSPLAVDTESASLTSAGVLLSTTPSREQFVLRMLPPPVPLAPESPLAISSPSQSRNHRGPSDYHPSGPANPFAGAVQQQSSPPSFHRHERRDAIWQLPTTAFLAQNIPVPSVESATTSWMQSGYYPTPAPAQAPAPSRRVARYRARIAPVIEAHVQGESALKTIMTSPRRWFRERRDDEHRWQ